jgi:cytochrome c-type biogenesis protein CcmH
LNIWLYSGGAVLILTALLFAIVPLLRYRKQSAVGIALPVILVGFPIAVYLLYAQVSTYPEAEVLASIEQTASPEGQAAAVDEMVRDLAARMQTEPTVEGLTMLGQSYIVMQRFNEAADAWHAAWELTEGKDADVSINYAEALILADRDTLRTSAVDLLDFGLEQQPNNAKALWYGGLSAAALEDNSLAIERWTRLLNDSSLPDDLRGVLQQQLAAMGADVPAQPVAATAGTVIQATIGISPELAEQGSDEYMLFLIARDVNQPRPPMAVKRVRAGNFPQTLQLSDADLMMPGRSLGDVEELEVIARISISGDPIAAAGDLYGNTVPTANPDGTLQADILINKIVE